MFTEALTFAPAIIGLIVSGTLGLVAAIWFFTRPEPVHIARKVESSRQ